MGRTPPAVPERGGTRETAVLDRGGLQAVAPAIWPTQAAARCPLEAVIGRASCHSDRPDGHRGPPTNCLGDFGQTEPLTVH